MTYREIVRRLRDAGFVFERQAKGSHEIWYNPRTKRRTTVPNHPGMVPRGTAHAIVRAAGITVKQFLSGDPDRGEDQAPGGRRILPSHRR
jgi:predicted RNA binding protein YcfA (HicA-like mRNA interferase family)